MKPTSKIFLIFSVVLVIIGSSLYIVGYGIAKKDEKTLFSQLEDEDGNSKIVYDISEENLNKINLDIWDADINISPTDSNSYIELINFNEIFFNYSIQNKIMKMKMGIDLLSFFKVSDTGLSFDGIRNYFKYVPNTFKRKQINIYLSDDENIRVFDIELQNGNIDISGISSNSDYLILLNSGDINFKNIENASLFEGEIENGNIYMSDFSAKKVLLEAKKGNVELNTGGYAFAYDLKTEFGEITANGESLGSDYYHGDPEMDSLRIRIVAGDIKIYFDENN